LTVPDWATAPETEMLQEYGMQAVSPVKSALEMPAVFAVAACVCTLPAGSVMETDAAPDAVNEKLMFSSVGTMTRPDTGTVDAAEREEPTSSGEAPIEQAASARGNRQTARFLMPRGIENARERACHPNG
jgi:hypothetical protein